jgi:type II secretory pathway component GspD/PulD (secretin)
MRLRPALTALFALAAFGQSGSITIYLTNAGTPESMRGLYNAVRTIGDIRDAVLDDTNKTITVSGTPEQNALAQWLCTEMDLASPPSGPAAVRHDYQVPGSDLAAVQVYFLAHTRTPQQIQSLVNASRAIAEIQRAVPDYTHNAILMRGTPDQIALLDWLFSEIDAPSPAVPNTTTRDYRLDGDPRIGLAQVVFLAHALTPEQVTGIVNLPRSLADIQRLFPARDSGVLVMRASAEQVAFADWLIGLLDRPTSHDPARPGSVDFTVETSDAGLANPANLARVYYLASPHTAESGSDLVQQLRASTNIPRAYFNPAHNALAMRGSDEQIARADALIRQLDR